MYEKKTKAQGNFFAVGASAGAIKNILLIVFFNDLFFEIDWMRYFLNVRNRIIIMRPTLMDNCNFFS